LPTEVNNYSHKISVLKNLKVEFKNIASSEARKVILAGNLTSMDAIEFKRSLLQTMLKDGKDYFIDITNLDAIDVTGVNALAMAHKKAERAGFKAVILSSVENPAEEFLHLTKFKNILNFEKA